MRTRDILSALGVLLISVSPFFFISCDDNEDDGSRGFMTVVTIMGDSKNGYYCYQDGGGLAISYDANLDSIERGYVCIYYTENDWTTSADGIQYIDHAHIWAWVVYDVIHPVSKEEAESKHITDNDSLPLPSRLSIGRAYRGYFDLNFAGITVNMDNSKEVHAKVNLVYDPVKQTADTLRLQLYYNPGIPVDWLNTSNSYCSMSCDISSLTSLQQWRDSVTIVINTVDGKEYLTSISKDDFLKPDIKTEKH